ncbi:hypothetical protein AB0O58_19690 [Rhodococcus sp. NPDC080181]|jgi:hypothetical protein|nr:hypothetical protein [Rhodococcus sp. PvP104]MBP2527479.1 hypothetical protein [Rhodococcus sp. PvP104]
MPICPNGCVDGSDVSFELETGFDQNHKPACICPACGYRDLLVDLCAA